MRQGNIADDVRLLTSGKDPLVQLPSGLKARKHARTTEIDLTEYFFDTGMNSGEEGPHAHSFTTAVLVTSGRFELKFVDGGEHLLSAGDSYVASAGQKHMVTCLEAGSYVVAKPLPAPVNGNSSAAHDHGHEHGDAHTHGQ